MNLSSPAAPLSPASGWEMLLGHLKDGDTLLDWIYSVLGVDTATSLLKTCHIHVVALPLDTNLILADLKRAARYGGLTAIMQTWRTGLVHFLITTRVREEVPTRMERVITDPALRAVALDIWEHAYLPWLYVLDVSDVADLTDRVRDVRACDPDDVDTAIVIELVNPPLVFALDYKHLGTYNLPPLEDWAKGAVAYRSRTRSASARLNLSASGVMLLSYTIESLVHLVPAVVALGKRLPLWLQLALGAGAVLSLAHPTSRRWLQQQGASAASALVQGGLKMGEWLHTLELTAQVDSVPLLQLERHEAPLDTDLSAVVRVLATTPGRQILTPTMIAARMVEAGYSPRSPHPEIAVGRVLHRYSRLFEQPVRGHWRLKRIHS